MSRSLLLIAIWLGAASSGCGGAVGRGTAGDEDVPDPGASPASGDAASQPASEDTPPPLAAPSACSGVEPGALRAEAVWSAGRSAYGDSNPGVLAFSGDGRRLVASAGSYWSTTLVVDATDGTAVESNSIEGWPLSRDASWKYELRKQSTYGGPLSLVDLGTSETVWSTPDGFAVGALSADGRTAAGFRCDHGSGFVAAWSVPDGALREFALGSACGDGGYFPPSFDLTPDGRVAVVSPPGTQDVVSVMLDTGRVSKETIVLSPADAAAAPRYAPGDVLSVRASPDGTQVAVLGSDGVLRLRRLPGLEPTATEWLATWSTVYQNCYCDVATFAPLAWSFDGKLVASLGESKAVTIRRACDGAVVGSIPYEIDLAHYSYPEDDGPTRLAFSRDGTLLAVEYTGTVKAYRLTPL